MIVSFSGIDSAGKTTQIDLLYSYCLAHKISVKKMWSKARGTPGVLFLKQLVRKDKKMDGEQKTEYRNEVFRNPKKKKLLYIASMLDLLWYWGIYYRILGCTHKILICDRYIWDTYVEIHKDFDGIDFEHSLLWKAVRKFTPKPRFSFVFIVPAEVSLERDRKKNAAGIEKIEVKKKKIALYMELVSQNRWTNVMDGMKSIEALHTQVLEILGLKHEN